MTNAETFANSYKSGVKIFFIRFFCACFSVVYAQWWPS